MTDGRRRFARDIRPLFLPTDVEAMAFALDLSSYESVRTHADAIWGRLSDGSMPCDRTWPADQLTVFREWLDGGMQP